MNFIRNLTESGLTKDDLYQDRRAVILTNSVSLILSAAVGVLLGIRALAFGRYNLPINLVLATMVFILPLIMNRFSWTKTSRLWICVAPPILLWYIFISAMTHMDELTTSMYDGLRIYLLAGSCIPYLVLSRQRPWSLVMGILPYFVSIFFFDMIFDAFAIGFKGQPGSDYEFMQIRFIVSYLVISGGCFMFQSVILRNDEINRCLIANLEQKKAHIEHQNNELLQSRNELAQVNQKLEQMVEDRTKKISEQQSRILSYAYANAHYVRGPIARLMGLVELYKIDRELDCDWLLKTVDRETRDIDTTIRKISAELQSVD